MAGPEYITQLHTKACRDGKMSYRDPESGLEVFTELFHRQRGYCCGSGCRHCPYKEQIHRDDEIVPTEKIGAVRPLKRSD